MDCMVTWVHKEWDTTERLSRSRKDVVFALSIGEVISKPLEWHAWGSTLGFSGGAGGKEPTCQSRRHKRHGFDPWIGKIPWIREWLPLQFSCLENVMDRGAWRATVHGVAKELDTT